MKNYAEQCDPDQLMRACIVIHDRLEGGESKPGADRWISNSHYRAKLRQMIVDRWCELTGLEAWQFPWSDDTIWQFYVGFRKSTNSTKPAIRRTLLGHTEEVE